MRCSERPARSRSASLASVPTRARLDRLVEAAIVDCYNESEQVAGLYTMIEENLTLRQELPLVGMRHEPVVHEDRVARLAWTVLERQGDQVTKPAARERVVVGEEPRSPTAPRRVRRRCERLSA